jgi:hypothetical protein
MQRHVFFRRELNLPINSKNQNVYGGIGEGYISAVFTHVRFGVAGEVIFSLYAGFSDAPSAVPILGQTGCFDRFEVKFNKPKEVIELKFIDPDPKLFLREYH